LYQIPENHLQRIEVLWVAKWDAFRTMELENYIYKEAPSFLVF